MWRLCILYRTLRRYINTVLLLLLSGAIAIDFPLFSDALMGVLHNAGKCPEKTDKIFSQYVAREFVGPEMEPGQDF